MPRNAQRALCNGQRVLRNASRKNCNVQRNNCNPQRMLCNAQRTPCNAQQKNCNTQRDICNPQSGYCNASQDNCNGQRNDCNAQRMTCCPGVHCYSKHRQRKLNSVCCCFSPASPWTGLCSKSRVNLSPNLMASCWTVNAQFCRGEVHFFSMFFVAKQTHFCKTMSEVKALYLIFVYYNL